MKNKILIAALFTFHFSLFTFHLIAQCTLGIRTSSTPYFCAALPGSATAIAYSGTPPYTYLWSPGGQTTASVTGLSAGSYSVSVWDNSSCTASSTITVSTGSVTLTTATFTLITSGDSAYLTATTNTSSSTFSWTPANSVTSPNSQNTWVTPTVTTTYTCTETTPCGVLTDTVTVEVVPFICHLTVSTTSTPYFCNNLAGTATANPANGTPPYTYLWNPTGQTTQTATGLSGGSYTVDVSDSMGCTASSVVSISNSSSNISLTIGTFTIITSGDSAYLTATTNTSSSTFSWTPANSVTSPNSQNTWVTPTVTTTYTCTETTPCGVLTDTVTVEVVPFICHLTVSTTSTPYFCNALPGSATAHPANGTPPYTYLWNPTGQTTQTAIGLSGGSYTVDVSDSLGCTASSVVSISNSSSSISLTIGTFTIITSGDSAYLTATTNTSSSTFSWTPANSVTSPNSQNTWVTPTVTTTYTCTETTPCGVLTDTVTVEVVPFICHLTVSTTSTPYFCNNLAGTATANPANGTPPYTYLWNPTGQTNQTATGLSGGSYTVDVSDSLGCTASSVVSISNSSSSISLTIGTFTIITSGDSAYLTATTNTSSSTFSWTPANSVTSPNSQNTWVTPTVTTTYTCTETTPCGVLTDTVTVEVVPFICRLTVSTTSTPYFCNALPGSATANPANGTPPYTYLWNPTGQTTQTATGLSGGSYTVDVSDSMGCNASSVVSISNSSSNISLTIGTFTIITSGDSAYLTATTNTSSSTFSWTPANSVTSPNSQNTWVTPTVTTTYTCTETTPCGVLTDTVTVEVVPFICHLTVSTTSTPYFCNNLAGTATANPANGTPPYTYLWNPTGQTTQTATGLSGGSYTVDVSDSMGCTASSVVSISNSSSSISLTIGTFTIITSGDSAYLTATTNTSSSTFSWTPANSVTSPNSQNTWVTPTVTTTYTCTETTPCGVLTDTVTVEVVPFICRLTVSTTSTPYFCNNLAGTATANPANGTSPYTYLWNPTGQTTQTATGLSGGSYTVDVSDSLGCTASSVVSISNSSSSISLTIGTFTIITSGDSAYLTATTNTSSSTFSWTPASSVTSPNSQYTWVTPTVTTTYTCTETTPCGVLTDTVTVEVVPFICHLTVSTTSTPYFCNNLAGTTTAHPANGTPPYTYLWNPTGQTTQTATGLSGGSYTVDVSDSMGCNASSVVSISNSSSSISLTIGTFTIITSGDSAYLTATTNTSSSTFSWTPANSVTSPNSQNTWVTPTVTTTYTCTETTPCGVLTDTVTVEVVPFICHLTVSTTSTPYFCNALPGSATAHPANGTLPYTYLWNPTGQTTQTATGLSGGSYTVDVSDSMGCNASSVVSISNSSSSISLTIGTFTIITSGDSAYLTATTNTSSSTFSWTPANSVTSPNSQNTWVTPTVTTTYTCTETTPCGVLTDTVTVEVVPFICRLTISTTSTPYFCNNLAGTATANPANGTPPYTYLWNPTGQTTQTATGLSGGSYTVDVSDSMGCTASSVVSISNSSSSISLTVGTFTLITSGDSAFLKATTNTSSATFSWTPSTFVTSPNSRQTWVTPTITTTYTVTEITPCDTLRDTVTVVVNCQNIFDETICIVTVDTAANRNLIIWERLNSPPQPNGAYNIYKDSSSTFALLETQPLTALSEYEDTASRPSLHNDSYKLSTFDSCGESRLSPFHTSIFLTVTSSGPNNILNWTAYIGFTVGKYYIYRGTSLSTLIKIDSVSSTTYTYTDVAAPPGSVYLVEATNLAGTCIPTLHIKPRGPNETSGSLSNIVNTSVTGIQNVYNNNNISVFPNPFHNTTTISVNTYGKYELELDDVAGRILSTIEFTGNQYTLSSANLAQGLYFIKVYDGDKRFVGATKVVVQ